MDPGAALARMSQLLAPGGTLVVVGLARSRLPDLPRDAVAVITNLGHRVTKGYWQHPSPTVWPPPHSHPEIRVLAGETLPGARYRRHLLWRYSLVWVKPGFRSCHALSAECSGLPQYPGGRPVPAARRVGLGYRTSCPGCGCAGIEPSRPAW